MYSVDSRRMTVLIAATGDLGIKLDPRDDEAAGRTFLEAASGAIFRCHNRHALTFSYR